jgi:hypothetical protein
MWLARYTTLRAQRSKSSALFARVASLRPSHHGVNLAAA